MCEGAGRGLSPADHPEAPFPLGRLLLREGPLPRPAGGHSDDQSQSRAPEGVGGGPSRRPRRGGGSGGRWLCDAGVRAWAPVPCSRPIGSRRRTMGPRGRPGPPGCGSLRPAHPGPRPVSPPRSGRWEAATPRVPPLRGSPGPSPLRGPPATPQPPGAPPRVFRGCDEAGGAEPAAISGRARTWGTAMAGDSVSDLRAPGGRPSPPLRAAAGPRDARSAARREPGAGALEASSAP